MAHHSVSVFCSRKSLSSAHNSPQRLFYVVFSLIQALTPRFKGQKLSTISCQLLLKRACSFGRVLKEADCAQEIPVVITVLSLVIDGTSYTASLRAEGPSSG